MSNRTVAAFVFALGCAAACGKPMDPSGKEDPLFTKASVTMPTIEGADRPLAADLAVLPVSHLVMHNRLKTPEKLQDALNKTPGQFSHLDLDKDGTPDPLTVAKKDAQDGHAFEIRVRPSSGEYVVATLLFDPEWDFLGHYSGAMGGAASTVGRPLPVTTMTAPAPAPAPSPAPTPVAAGAVDPGAPAVAGAPAPTTAPATGAAPTTAVAGGVQAVPAGSEAQPGVKTSP